MATFKIDKKKFTEDYYSAFTLKKDLLDKYNFSNYEKLNKYVEQNKIEITTFCKVCNTETIIQDKEEFKSLEYGTVCSNHLGFYLCNLCNNVWINSVTQKKCYKCSQKFEQEKKTSLSLWSARTDFIWNNIKRSLDKETIDTLYLIYNNIGFTSNKINSLIKEFEIQNNYNSYPWLVNGIIDYLLNNELIFKYNNKYVILPQILELIKKKTLDKYNSNINKNEDRVYRLLTENFPKLNLLRQQSPSWVKPLRFDFYSEKYRVAIEWHGQQHYMPVDKFGGEKSFPLNQERDNRKRKLCKENNFKFIELKYNLKDNEIIDIIKMELNL